MAKTLHKCPNCKLIHTFFPLEDIDYETGDIESCPKCGLEIIIDFEGEEGSDQLERHIFWYK